jgi:hypothetical protein
MKALGSAILAIIVGLVALVLLVKLVFFTLKLVGVVIAVAIAVGVYFVVKKKMLQGDRT